MIRRLLLSGVTTGGQKGKQYLFEKDTNRHLDTLEQDIWVVMVLRFKTKCVWNKKKKGKRKEKLCFCGDESWRTDCICVRVCMCAQSVCSWRKALFVWPSARLPFSYSLSNSEYVTLSFLCLHISSSASIVGLLLRWSSNACRCELTSTNQLISVNYHHLHIII